MNKKMENKKLSFYFLLQGALGILWWILLIIFPNFRQLFALYKSHSASIFSFFLPDVLFFCLGSLICSWAVLKNKEWSNKLINFVIGGIFYVTLFCFNHSLLENEGWISAICMILCIIPLTFILIKINNK